MMGVLFWGHRKRGRYHCPEAPDGPEQPILNAVSLRDMIDMTTSGSGSGKNSLTYAFYHKLY